MRKEKHQKTETTRGCDNQLHVGMNSVLRPTSSSSLRPGGSTLIISFWNLQACHTGMRQNCMQILPKQPGTTGTFTYLWVEPGDMHLSHRGEKCLGQVEVPSLQSLFSPTPRKEDQILFLSHVFVPSLLEVGEHRPAHRVLLPRTVCSAEQGGTLHRDRSCSQQKHWKATFSGASLTDVTAGEPNTTKWQAPGTSALCLVKHFHGSS